MNFFSSFSSSSFLRLAINLVTIDVTINSMSLFFKGQAPPAIVKLINTEVKSRIMRVKKNLPKEGLRLVDDCIVTFSFSLAILLMKSDLKSSPSFFLIVHDIKFSGILLIVIAHSDGFLRSGGKRKLGPLLQFSK
jgi:hypothetical protein